MTLVTTAGAADADSYAAVADADAYFSSRGIATWTGATGVKENALRRGTTYLDNQYRQKWIGIRATATQSLAWPRCDGARGRLVFYPGYLLPLFDIDGFQILSTIVPQQVISATIEAALLALTGVSLESRLERGGLIKSQHDKVDVLETETVWQDGAPAVDRYTVIEGLLRGLVTGTPGASSGSVQMVRG
jgi:hypothetical protein